MSGQRQCSIDGCERPYLANGWCRLHYSRWRKHGNPLTTKKTPHGEPYRFFCDVVLPYQSDQCLIWPYTRNNKGYGFMRKDGRDQPVSRLACEELHGPPPSPEYQAAHNCGNGHGGCCAPHHVRWATKAENEHDKVIHRTSLRGAKSPAAKLTEADVKGIRMMRGHMTQAALGRQYGVSRETINQIVRGMSWAEYPSSGGI